MWGVPPGLLCRKHLLGEHVEMHMFVGALRKGKNITGHIQKEQVDLRKLQKRHEVLAREMRQRGYQHQSPLEYLYVPYPLGHGIVDIEENLKTLASRCADCADRQRRSV